MKICLLAWVVYALVAVEASAAVRFVKAGNGSAAPPYTSWPSAAATIQDAVDASDPGDLVLVTNGIYQVGGRPDNYYGNDLSNRVLIDRAITVQSVNGPAVTTILGNPVSGTNAVRCVNIGDNAVLNGFTLKNGGTMYDFYWADVFGNYQQQCGGGVTATATAIVTNCIITGCTAYFHGGGTSGGLVRNCAITNNTAANGVGGGAVNSALENCEIVNNHSAGGGGGTESGALTNCALFGNSAGGNGGGAELGLLVNCVLAGNFCQGDGGGFASGTANNCNITANKALGSGGGVAGTTLNNCILAYNTSINGGNFNDSTLNFCCATPLPDNGTNNLTTDAQLLDSGHLKSTSPCIAAGSPLFSPAADIDGEVRPNPPSIGCDEFSLVGGTGALSVAIQSSFTNVATGFPARFTGIVLGHATNLLWSLGDATSATNLLSPTHSFASPGNFTVTLTAYNASNAAGVSSTIVVHVVAQPVFYVKASNTSPAPPFNSWATAATNIQDAIDAAAVPGSLVLVTNGVYQKGGKPAYSSLTNRVAVTIPLDVRSVNGPALTTISGNPILSGNAVRCVYLASGAQLTGFTLSNGATLDGGSLTLEQSGGAVRCESADTIVSNCVIAGNFALGNGGGIEGGTVLNCGVTGNTANSGGGAHGAALSNCIISRNSANANGGALASCTVYNSALFANSSHVSAGAAESSTLVGCTISGNSASISGGGVDNSTLKNSIAFFNTAPQSANFSASVLNYCCTTPLPPNGANNIASDPQLTDGAHISAGSPCVGAGSSSYLSGPDIDGEVWASPPSIGCDEFHPDAVTSTLTVSILAAYTNVTVGFPVNLSGLILGHATNSLWNFADGSFATNQLYPAHSWSSPGDYLVTFTAYNNANPAGVTATIAVHVTSQTVFYVAATNISPVAPFNSWATAATNIQDAADIAGAGGTLLVNDGLYQFGGHVVFGALTNRVALVRPLNLQSLNGPAATIIAGNYVNDDTAVRGVSLANGCTMTGFTVTNVATRAAGDIKLEQSGAGIWCESTNVLVTDCFVTTCSAPQLGGGAFFGTFFNSTFTNCSAGNGGGAHSAALNNCSVNGNYGNGAVNCTIRESSLIANSGIGAFLCVLTNCTVMNNSSFAGGGVNLCTVFGSTISGNSASRGGGAFSSTLFSCVLSNNVGGASGGGAESCTLSNCTLIANSAGNNGGGANFCTVQYCTLLSNSVTGDGGGAYGCIMSDCTVKGNQADGNGGGACASALARCALTGNSAAEGGGYNGFSSISPGQGNFVSNCAVYGNTANNGGGVESCQAVNCTISGNSAGSSGGGAKSSTLENCIAYHNDAVLGVEYDSSTLSYCCTLPLPPSGPGNITNEPRLADFAHISAGSPCRGAGSAAYAGGTDIDGDAWANPPSIGCDEFNSASATGPLAVSVSTDFTNCASGFTVHFAGQIIGHATSNLWNFGDGTFATNQLYLGHSWASGGNYTVTLTAFNGSNPGGMVASVLIHVSLNPIYYVSLASTNPVSPFSSWITAATNIQDAADVAVAGGTVLVTNGVYNQGGRVAAGAVSNRISVVTPIIVRSVNGPAASAIEGFPVTDYTAVRCVYLTNGALLSGFTLTNGATRNDTYDGRDYNGAGVWCESYRASVSNCVLIGNIGTGNGGGGYNGTYDNCTFMNNSSWSGGGADSAVLRNCMFSNNACIYGGGASGSILTNCILIGNQTLHDSDYTENGGGAATSTLVNCVLKNNLSLRGGGASSCSLLNCTVIYNTTKEGQVFPAEGGGVLSCAVTNCIVYFNQASNGTNYSDDSTLYYSDTSPMPTNGANNIVNDPSLADTFHISSTSPCRGAGTAAATSGVDIDGDPWLDPPSIGADEFNSSSATGALAVAFSETFTNVIPGLVIDFTAQVSGHATANRWSFGDGTFVTNQLVLSHSWSAPGNYIVTFTAYNTDHPTGVSASVTIYILANPIHYVALNNPSPAPPYFSWATAATNIQDALDVAFAGGTVIVSNGVYQTGGLKVFEGSTNRVAVAKPLALQSVDGAGATVIDGGHAMRCLYLTNNVTVSGFTLINGVGNNGGGVFCENNDVLNYCAFISNSTPADYTSGGGGYRGIYNWCTFAGNSASFLGAAAVYAGLNSCVISNNGPASYGGAAVQSSLNTCLVLSNSAAWGGGVENCEADNCLLLGNSATYGGGGAIWSVENSCTIVGNYAPLATPGYYSGAGVFDGTANNCIIYYNNGDNCTADFEGLTLNHCCTTPDPGGIMDITVAPLFVNFAANDFHLKTNSPCINAGNNAFAVGTNDLDGAVRITGGTVDIGAYEFPNPTSLLSYAWAQRYGFPTDGSADFADPDGDGMNNWQEWIAGTSPINAASVLKMLSPSNSTTSVTVTWQSVNGINYFLQRSPSLAPTAFVVIQTNIPGQAGTTTFTDTNTIVNGRSFYRVGVQH